MTLASTQGLFAKERLVLTIVDCPFVQLNFLYNCLSKQNPILCDPMDYIVHGILQARILEWVAAPFSRGSSQPRDQTQVSLIAGGFFTS